MSSCVSRKRAIAACVEGTGRDADEDEDCGRASVRRRLSHGDLRSAHRQVCSSRDVLIHLLGWLGFWTDVETMLKVAWFVGASEWPAVRAHFWRLPDPPVVMTVDRLRVYPRGAFDFAGAMEAGFKFILRRCDSCEDACVWSVVRMSTNTSVYSELPVFYTREYAFSWIKPGKYGPDLTPLYCDECLHPSSGPGAGVLRDNLLSSIHYYGDDDEWSW